MISKTMQAPQAVGRPEIDTPDPIKEFNTSSNEASTAVDAFVQQLTSPFPASTNLMSAEILDSGHEASDEDEYSHDTEVCRIIVGIGTKRPLNPQKAKARHGSCSMENANQSFLWVNEKVTQERDEERQVLMNVTHIQDQAIASIKEYTDKMMGTSEKDKGSLFERDQAIKERDQAIKERDQAINAHRGITPRKNDSKVSPSTKHWKKSPIESDTSAAMLTREIQNLTWAFFTVGTTQSIKFMRTIVSIVLTQQAALEQLDSSRE